MFSDIVYALAEAANTGRRNRQTCIPFIWKVARNVYADLFGQAKENAQTAFCDGASDEILLSVADPEGEPDEHRRTIAHSSFIGELLFLTKAYREAMILFYIDGLSASRNSKKAKHK